VLAIFQVGTTTFVGGSPTREPPDAWARTGTSAIDIDAFLTVP